MIAAGAVPAFADNSKTADAKFEAAGKLREDGKVQEARARCDESTALKRTRIGTN